MPRRKGQKKAKELTTNAPIKEHKQNDFDFVIDQFDLKKLTRNKKGADCDPDDIESRPGVVYPEILWYLISPFIAPEDIKTFALINQATYAITKRESFWYSIYKRYCANSIKLPERLRIDKDYRAYGLRQNVIRALHFTYKKLRPRIEYGFVCECRPYSLVGWTCIDSWMTKIHSRVHWHFKLKKQKDYVGKWEQTAVEANPEEDNKCLLVNCRDIYPIPPLIGMTISSMAVNLSQGFTCQKLNLDFSKSAIVSKDTVPDISLTIDSVLSYNILDWWHPKYPYFEVKPPGLTKNEESPPILRVDFNDLCEEDVNFI